MLKETDAYCKLGSMDAELLMQQNNMRVDEVARLDAEIARFADCDPSEPIINMKTHRDIKAGTLVKRFRKQRDELVEDIRDMANEAVRRFPDRLHLAESGKLEPIAD